MTVSIVSPDKFIVAGMDNCSPMRSYEHKLQIVFLVPTDQKEGKLLKNIIGQSQYESDRKNTNDSGTSQNKSNKTIGDHFLQKVFHNKQP